MMEVIHATDLGAGQWQLTVTFTDTPPPPGSRFCGELGQGAIMAARTHELDLLFYANGPQALPSAGQTLDLTQQPNTDWQPPVDANNTVILGKQLGIADAVYTCRLLKTQQQRPALVILQSDKPFPFKAEPSRIMLPGLPSDVIATMPLLEDWKIACRLAREEWQPGCFEGKSEDLLQQWMTDTSQYTAQLVFH